MKGGQTNAPPEKTTLKKPSLIRVKLKYEVNNQETISFN